MSKKVKPSGGLAVMADRHSALDKLDDFPTPPWGTRALIYYILPQLLGCSIDDFNRRNYTCWEPAANRKIMADVLSEHFAAVHTSDVHDYGYPCDEIGSFVGDGDLGLDVAHGPIGGADFIITNPPFKLATPFARRALAEARIGVALLLRTVWLDTCERYHLFTEYQPEVLAPFMGRLPMVEGRYDPDASTATAYSWFIWLPGRDNPWQVMMIPPAAERNLTRTDDALRFATRGNGNGSSSGTGDGEGGKGASG